MSQIRFGMVSVALPFKQRFLRKFGLQPYDPTKHRQHPAAFFGCYNANDIKTITAHRGLAVVIWGGTDALKLTKNPKAYRAFLNRANTHHIAISDWIARDLASVGAHYIKLPICPTELDRFGPTKFGDCVYFYYNPRPITNKIYRPHLVKAVAKKLPRIRFIGGHIYKRKLSYEQMRDVYSQCFLGLRLTSHDGLPNTVVELGLMGRKCLWNGSLPNAIRYPDNIDAIADIVQTEWQRINQMTTEQQIDEATKTAEEVKAYLQLPNWLDVKFYANWQRSKARH